MIRDYIDAEALEKGYTIEKEPIVEDYPIIGRIVWPIWFGFRWLYISPKKTRYYMDAVAAKFTAKREKRATKRRKKLFRILRKAGIHPQNPYSF